MSCSRTQHSDSSESQTSKQFDPKSNSVPTEPLSSPMDFLFFVLFVASRPKSTAMVMAGQSGFLE